MQNLNWDTILSEGRRLLPQIKKVMCEKAECWSKSTGRYKETPAQHGHRPNDLTELDFCGREDKIIAKAFFKDDRTGYYYEIFPDEYPAFVGAVIAMKESRPRFEIETNKTEGGESW